MKRLLLKALALVALCGAVYIYFTTLLYLACRDQLCFSEGVSTYISHRDVTSDILGEPGGVARLCALWLTQWFTGPWPAALVGAAPYTLMSVLALAIGRRLGCGLWSLPLLAAPVSALALMSCDIDYDLSGTAAYALMLVGILPLMYIRRAPLRLTASVIICIVMAWTCGAIVMLYSLMVLNIEALRDYRRGWWFALLPALAVSLGWMGVEAGYCRDMARALLPYAYYNHWASPSSVALLPWVSGLAVIDATALLRLLRMRRAALWRSAIAVCALAAVVLMTLRDCRDADRLAFARLSYLSGRQAWQQIAAEYRGMPHDNPVLRNIANMALAERGMLADVLFRSGNAGVESLLDYADRSPYTYMTLSDVYYSMGLVALAQKYAFEANQALGNHSPRMLRRLVDTNLVTGQNGVALKYIAMLEGTRNHSQWAGQRRRMAQGAIPLDDELAAKRECLFHANRFAGGKGIDDDMLQVLRANSAHTPTMQYLCAYYMLAKNVPRVIAVIEEFHDTPALRIPLPEHLQEALAVDALIRGAGVDPKYQVHPAVVQRCRDFWAEHRPQPNTLWQYLRERQPHPTAADANKRES